MDCIFCKIVSGDSPSHKVWEDAEYLAFLSIYPNTQGVTVVIPKKHYPSYVLDLPEDVYINLVLAAKKVAKLLDSKLEDVARTAIVAEGFGVDHAHLKLFPMHGTKSHAWKPMHSDIDQYFEQYPGYISSHDSAQADNGELEELAKKLQN
jgi:diadenosine tetraphosphate (Ap4A) HIT family hydrolase